MNGIKNIYHVAVEGSLVNLCGCCAWAWAVLKTGNMCFLHGTHATDARTGEGGGVERG